MFKLYLFDQRLKGSTHTYSRPKQPEKIQEILNKNACICAVVTLNVDIQHGTNNIVETVATQAAKESETKYLTHPSTHRPLHPERFSNP